MSESIESLDQFKSGPVGDHERWADEMDAARKASKDWRKAGAKTVKRFKATHTQEIFRLNLFYSNVNTVQSMMFGKLPEITFSRTNQDPNDDVARVAAMMLERMLSADIGTPTDQYSEALKNCLQDRLLPGLGIARVRYTFETADQEIAAITDIDGAEVEAARTEEQIINEQAPIDYVFWDDFLWGPARVWSEVPWVAFKTFLTNDEVSERFGEKVAKTIAMESQKSLYNESDDDGDKESHDAWMRAEVWEIWNKEDKTVIWWNKGAAKILDKKEDPLKLEGFFPVPEPMAANLTTSAYMPIPDFKMCEDLYNEVDRLEQRIHKITEAIKVVGVYDQSVEGVKRMLTEGAENDLIPVDNWASLAEKGGLNGVVDWMPIQEIAGTLQHLIARRNDAKAMLYEINGISDIMRGAQATGGAVSATERQLEARFSSVRIQALQDEFAKYATDLIRLRAEVVAKHFQPQSIVDQSNMAHTSDQELIGPALQLIKSDMRLIWRIEVKPESVAMVDYAQLRDDRTSYITGLATFLQSAAPLVAQDPAATPMLLEMLKWGLAGFKGSQEVEGVLDQAIQQIQESQKQQQGQEKPDPEQMKAQAQQQMQQMKQQGEMQKIQAQSQHEQQKHQIDMEHMKHELNTRLQEIQAETESKMALEKAQALFNIEEEKNETEEANKRELFKHELALDLLERTTAAQARVAGATQNGD